MCRRWRSGPSSSTCSSTRFTKTLPWFANPSPCSIPALLRPAIADSFRKLSPAVQMRNPVMFVVYIGSILTSILFVQALRGPGEAPADSSWHRRVAVVHGAVRELCRSTGRGAQQGAGGIAARPEAIHQREEIAARRTTFGWTATPRPELRKGDFFLVEAGDVIPADGEVIDGVASVDESAITGESAPVVRESGGDFSAVTGGTRVLSDWLVVRVAVNPGEAFIDRMIAMVEAPSGRRRRMKSP
jgi:K+-transporting ATPase ATPase B chain